MKEAKQMTTKAKNLKGTDRKMLEQQAESVSKANENRPYITGGHEASSLADDSENICWHEVAENYVETKANTNTKANQPAQTLSLVSPGLNLPAVNPLYEIVLPQTLTASKPLKNRKRKDTTNSSPPKKKNPKISHSTATSVPATIPTNILVVDGVEWITFTYEVKGQPQQFQIRTDIDHLSCENDIPADFKLKNCVYLGAIVDESEYKGNRYKYERSVNHIGWKLCHMNPFLCEKKGLIQRAVDSFRNRFEKLRSRRVNRQEKFLNGSLRQRGNTTKGKVSAKAEVSSATPPMIFSPSRSDQNYSTTLQDSRGEKLSGYTTSQLHQPSSHLQYNSPDQPQHRQKRQQIQQQQITPLLSAGSFALTPMSINIPSLSYDRIQSEASVQKATVMTIQESLIALHYAAKHKITKPSKSLHVETVNFGKIYRFRIFVDIERVDAILASINNSNKIHSINSNDDSSSRNSNYKIVDNFVSEKNLSDEIAGFSIATTFDENSNENMMNLACSPTFRRNNAVFSRACDGFDTFVEYARDAGLTALFCAMHSRSNMQNGWRPMSGEADVTEVLKCRFENEVLLNEIAWRIALLNLKGIAGGEYGGAGCREVLQKAVDTYVQKFSLL
ncbi:hypothetical protein HK100_007988 [Physocladia obscura]|uniref:DUF8032 domain-containing protein n=1 Tax=Physocladia obscura TaxID=109957 RepID=A0AAD5T746_9FUNG|nr:hypothetical protein HK100_007988 [Physocladia obscura]